MLLWSNFLESIFFIFFWIVCFKGWVLYFGLYLFLVILDFVFLVNFIWILCLVNCFVNWVVSKVIICFNFFFCSEWNIIVLLIWLINFGWNVCFKFCKIWCFIVLWFLSGLIILKFIDLFCFIFWVLILEVIMMIVFLKLIICFLELVKWLLLSICSNILNIFGCVFLILFKRIIE